VLGFRDRCNPDYPFYNRGQGPLSHFTMVMAASQLADLMPTATQLESDEPEMESTLHYAQLALLVSCLAWLWRDQTDFFMATGKSASRATASIGY